MKSKPVAKRDIGTRAFRTFTRLFMVGASWALFLACSEDKGFEKIEAVRSADYRTSGLSLNVSLEQNRTKAVLTFDDVDLSQIRIVKTFGESTSVLPLSSNSYVDYGINQKEILYSLQKLNELGEYETLSSRSVDFASSLPFTLESENLKSQKYDLRIDTPEIGRFGYTVRYYDKNQCADPAACSKTTVATKTASISSVNIFPVRIKDLSKDVDYAVEIETRYASDQLKQTFDHKETLNLPGDLDFAGTITNKGPTKFDLKLSWTHTPGFEHVLYRYEGSDCSADTVDLCASAQSFAFESGTSKTFADLSADRDYHFALKIHYRSKSKTASLSVSQESAFVSPRLRLEKSAPVANAESFGADISWDASSDFQYRLYRYDDRSAGTYSSCTPNNVATCGAELLGDASIDSRRVGKLSKTGLPVGLQHTFVLVTTYSGGNAPKNLTSSVQTSQAFVMGAPSLSATKTYVRNQILFNASLDLTGVPKNNPNIGIRLYRYSGICADPINNIAVCLDGKTIPSPNFPLAENGLRVDRDYVFMVRAQYRNPFKTGDVHVKNSSLNVSQSMDFVPVNFKAGLSDPATGDLYYAVDYSWDASADLNYNLYLIEGTNTCDPVSINTCTASNLNRFHGLNPSGSHAKITGTRTNLLSETNYLFILDVRFGKSSRQESVSVSKEVTFKNPLLVGKVADVVDSSYDVSLSWDRTTDMSYELYAYVSGRCSISSVESCDEASKHDPAPALAKDFKNEVSYVLALKTNFKSKSAIHGFAMSRSVDMTKWIKVSEADNGWVPRMGHESVVHDDKLWILGGLTGLAPDSTDDVWHSTNGRDFTRDVSLPQASHFGGGASYGGNILFFSGLKNSAHSDRRFVFDGTNWTSGTMDALLGNIAGQATITQGGNILMIGGEKSSFIGTSIGNQVFRYNGSWNQINSLSEIFPARKWTQATAFKNKIWIAGGFSGADRFNDVWHSEEGKRWDDQTADARWSKRYGHAMVSFDGKLWILGGYDGSNTLNDIWHSKDGKNWTRQAVSTVWGTRQFHRAIVFNGEIYVIGGLDSTNTLLKDVWKNTVKFTFQ